MSGLTKMELGSTQLSDSYNTSDRVSGVIVVASQCSGFLTFIIVHVGADNERKTCAILDELDNYSFSFAPGVDDSDLYPREFMQNYYSHAQR